MRVTLQIHKEDFLKKSKTLSLSRERELQNKISKINVSTVDKQRKINDYVRLTRKSRVELEKQQINMRTELRNEEELYYPLLGNDSKAEIKMTPAILKDFQPIILNVDSFALIYINLSIR